MTTWQKRQVEVTQRYLRGEIEHDERSALLDAIEDDRRTQEQREAEAFGHVLTDGEREAMEILGVNLEEMVR